MKKLFRTVLICWRIISILEANKQHKKCSKSSLDYLWLAKSFFSQISFKGYYVNFLSYSSVESRNIFEKFLKSYAKTQALAMGLDIQCRN